MAFAADREGSLMPRLLMFAPCEKVIIGQDNVVSLIGLFHEIQLQLPTGKDIPPDVCVPMKWAVFTLFQRNESEENKELEQKCVLVNEEDKTLITAGLRFKLSQQFNRIITEVLGFPIQKGPLRLKLWLREIEPSAEWKEIAEFPIKITHKTT
jgi:hypothetical protein